MFKLQSTVLSDWSGISASSDFFLSLLWYLSFTLDCTLADFDLFGDRTLAGDNSDSVPVSFVFLFVVALVTGTFRGDGVSIIFVGDV